MSEEPIISIEEFRKITGFASNDMDDSLVMDAINRLESLADIYIKQTSDNSDKGEF